MKLAALFAFALAAPHAITHAAGLQDFAEERAALRQGPSAGTTVGDDAAPVAGGGLRQVGNGVFAAGAAVDHGGLPAALDGPDPQDAVPVRAAGDADPAAVADDAGPAAFETSAVAAPDTVAEAAPAVPRDVLHGSAGAVDLATDAFRDPAATTAVAVAEEGRPSECPSASAHGYEYSTSDRCREGNGQLKIRTAHNMNGRIVGREVFAPRKSFMRWTKRWRSFIWFCGGNEEHARLGTNNKPAGSGMYYYVVYWADNGRICWYK